jgi:hypothetical protein
MAHDRYASRFICHVTDVVSGATLAYVNNERGHLWGAIEAH